MDSSWSARGAARIGCLPSRCIVVTGGYDERRAHDCVTVLSSPDRRSAISSGASKTDGEAEGSESTNGPSGLLASKGSWEEGGGSPSDRGSGWPSMNSRRYAHGMCSLSDNSVVCVGGHDGQNFLRSAEKWEVGSGAWKPLPNLHFPRGFIGCASLPSSRIVAVGGQAGSTVHKSAELYDAASSNWRALPPMQEARHSCACAAIGNQLFVFGGRQDAGNCGKVHKSCEMLELGGGAPRWKPLKPMRQARTGVAAVATSGRIYVIGGTSGVKPLSSVEIYTPSLSTWTAGPSLCMARAWPCAFVWDSKIVVYGGRESTAQEVVETVEVLDPLEEDGKWQIVEGADVWKSHWWYLMLPIGEPVLQDTTVPVPAEVPPPATVTSAQRGPSSLSLGSAQHHAYPVSPTRVESGPPPEKTSFPRRLSKESQPESSSVSGPKERASPLHTTTTRSEGDTGRARVSSGGDPEPPSPSPSPSVGTTVATPVAQPVDKKPNVGSDNHRQEPRGPEVACVRNLLPLDVLEANEMTASAGQTDTRTDKAEILCANLHDAAEEDEDEEVPVLSMKKMAFTSAEEVDPLDWFNS